MSQAISSPRSFEEAAPRPVHRKVATGAFLGVVTDGYILGIVGIALSYAQTPLGLTSFWMGLIGAGAMLGILFGSLLMGPLADRIGRRPPFLTLMGVAVVLSVWQFFIDDPRMLPVYEEAHRRGLPVLFHTGDSRTDYSSPYRLMRVIEKIPEFTCIAAHLGGYSEWKEARRELSGANVYIDTSSSLFKVSREEAEENIAHFGVDHTMFGTDFPMWQPKEELERFFALGYSQEENQAMLYDNFARLFHLD